MTRSVRQYPQMSRQSRPRVLFLTRRFWPAVGGVETHVAAIAQELKNAYDITIATEQTTKDLPLSEVREGIQVLRIPTKGKTWSKWQFWRWWWQHKALLQDADIVHIHDVFFWVQPLRVFFPFKKWLMTFHGYEPPQPSWRQKLQHQLAAWLTNGNICVGGFHQKWYGVRPTFITYGGAEFAAADKKNAHASSVKKIIFIGRVAEDTGIQSLLQALSHVEQKCELNIYGDGPLRVQLETQAKQLHHTIHFHGFNSNARQYIHTSDVAFASQYLSILEALAAGVPVISLADSPLKKDYLERTPFAEWIRITRNTEQLAKTLKTPQTLDPAAQEWARSQTWEKITQLYVRLWEN